MSTLYNNISHIITKVRGKICVISKHSERKKKTTSQSSVFFYFPNSTLGAGYWTLTRKRVLDITNLAPQWFYWWNALSCMSFCPSANSFLDVDGDLKPSTLQDCFAGPNSNGTQDLITFIQKENKRKHTFEAHSAAPECAYAAAWDSLRWQVETVFHCNSNC